MTARPPRASADGARATAFGVPVVPDVRITSRPGVAGVGGAGAVDSASRSRSRCATAVSCQASTDGMSQPVASRTAVNSSSSTTRSGAWALEYGGELRCGELGVQEQHVRAQPGRGQCRLEEAAVVAAQHRDTAARAQAEIGMQPCGLCGTTAIEFAVGQCTAIVVHGDFVAEPDRGHGAERGDRRAPPAHGPLDREEMRRPGRSPHARAQHCSRDAGQVRAGVAAGHVRQGAPRGTFQLAFEPHGHETLLVRNIGCQVRRFTGSGGAGVAE